MFFPIQKGEFSPSIFFVLNVNDVLNHAQLLSTCYHRPVIFILMVAIIPVKNMGNFPLCVEIIKTKIVDKGKLIHHHSKR
jgi:hypothetical protein